MPLGYKAYKSHAFQHTHATGYKDKTKEWLCRYNTPSKEDRYRTHVMRAGLLWQAYQQQG